MEARLELIAVKLQEEDLANYESSRDASGRQFFSKAEKETAKKVIVKMIAKKPGRLEMPTDLEGIRETMKGVEEILQEIQKDKV